MPRELPKAYDPTRIEDYWAAYWLEEKLFDTGDASAEQRRAAFTMLLPPPNVTGRLHMGHMLNQTEMDILTRWHRMRGQLAVWVPGTDHAGIATQMMVERKLAGEGTSREQMGREKFVERVWQWKQEYGDAILNQMKRLGVSVDWSREYFTMDEGLSRAVREAFVRLHAQGLIYRGAYIVNWCPRCKTAISDLEVVHEEHTGKLFEIRYPVVGADGEFVTIATTRPETMLGDVAVAVNPNDPRYVSLHGKRVRLPLVGREIPIVLDDYANPEFGTGAVKVTPAHDPNDFAIGQRHNLPQVSVMDDAARITGTGTEYDGLDRYESRTKILAALEAQGLLVAIKDHSYAIGMCDRCRTIVEPRLSLQWFLKIAPLAENAIKAVEDGYIEVSPEQYKKTYFEWMRNIHDWCISRQLWWGHRIPAWHCAACGEITVARETPEKCAHCGSAEMTQEKDVLDTWFSSALLPMSVFGWPERTVDLSACYPTSLLVTGFDILFFWVARMIMLGCHFMLDVPMADGSPRTLKDAVPFREVYIHALVRDADRQKMSKTKGNVIDPIEIIGRFGTDAVRFTLAAMASPGTDIAFSEQRTEGYRAFANKIWNAARFVFMQMENAKAAGVAVDISQLHRGLMVHPGSQIEARWIVWRLNEIVDAINSALEDYRFDEAAQAYYQFFWGEFCDWYLEAVKIRLVYGHDESNRVAQEALETLVATFEASLRLLSPFMPFITEELWHALYEAEVPARSIALAQFPSASTRAFFEERDFATLQTVIVAAREMRKSAGVPEKASGIDLVIVTSDGSLRERVTRGQELIQRLARVNPAFSLVSLPGAEVRHLPEFDIFLKYERKVDVAFERDRLSKELERLSKEWDNSQRQLQNESFLAKAPAKVVEGLRSRAAELPGLLEKTRSALSAVEG